LSRIWPSRSGKDLDTFDLICHVAFDQPPLTRRERADKVRKRNVFARYGDKARDVLHVLLDKYADGGLRSVESLEILKVDPLTRFGTPVEIVSLFGGKDRYLAAIRHRRRCPAARAAGLAAVPEDLRRPRDGGWSCFKTTTSPRSRSHLRWRNWAAKADEGMTGDDLLEVPESGHPVPEA
jgi:hypothetical protein